MLLTAAKADSAEWMSNLFKLYSKIYLLASTEHISVLQHLLEAAGHWSGGQGRPWAYKAQLWTSVHDWAL